MKRKTLLILSLLMLIFVLVGCNSSKTVEFNLFTPTSDSSDEDMAEFDEENFIDWFNDGVGVVSAKLNRDEKAVTVSMSTDEYKDMVKEQKLKVDDILESVVESVSYVNDIKYTKDYKKIELLVSNEGSEKVPQVVDMIGFPIMHYLMILNKDYKVTFIIKDIDTGKEINSILYPDDFNYP